MKTSKKILYILTSLFAVALISAGISIGFEMFFNFSFWKSFFFVSVVQILTPILWNKYYESKELVDAAKEYASKPFRRYIIGLNCAHCGKLNKVDVDLSETEFKCSHCKKDNGVHVEFMTAAITEPISDTNFL